MMYRVRLYNWMTQERIGEPYNTNVLPTPKMLISYGDVLWEVVHVRHFVAHPGSAIARGGEPEWVEAIVGPGRDPFYV